MTYASVHLLWIDCWERGRVYLSNGSNCLRPIEKEKLPRVGRSWVCRLVVQWPCFRVVCDCCVTTHIFFVLCSKPDRQRMRKGILGGGRGGGDGQNKEMHRMWHYVSVCVTVG